MINKLIEHIVALLRDNITSSSQIRQQIISGPASEPASDALPAVVVVPGKLELSQRVRDATTGQPRAEELRQEFVLDPASPAGPYTLTQIPSPGSVRCQLVFDQGTAKERRMPLIEKQDFMVDQSSGTIRLIGDIVVATSMVVQYSFTGLSTTSEFQQEFLVDVYAASMADVEQWASLALSIILTNHHQLLRSYNLNDRTEYSVRPFATTHTIDQIQFLDGLPDLSGTISKLELRWRAAGRLKSTQASVDGYDVIRTIRSGEPDKPDPADVAVAGL